ncbi:C-X-C chemokine receptor type 3-2-like [Pleurodeles waltl]|uniref:C-X-C chemokine receptor type 3-2-like n=1 Tax=Pleurodeles waltl TaxID=8319 RepID=UPI003709A83B
MDATSSYLDGDEYGSAYYSLPTDLPDLSEETAPCTMESIGHFNTVFIPIAFSLIFVLGLVGNGLVLLVLGLRKCPWHLADHYLLQLAVADLLLCLTLPFWVTQFAHGWVLGRIPCKLLGALFTLNMYSTVFFLACISLDRFLAIVHAMDLYRRQRPIHTHLLCLLVWSICLGFAGVEIFFREVEFSVRARVFFCHNAFAPIDANKWRIALRLTNLSMGFLIPLLIMVFCYSQIFCSLHRSNLFAKHKSLKVVVVLLVVFVLCWAPYNTFLLVDSLQRLGYIDRNCYLEQVLDFGVTITECLGLAHCCLNPIIYAFIGVKFRHELVRLFKKSRLQNQRSNLSPSSGHQSCREHTVSSSAEQATSTIYPVLM